MQRLTYTLCAEVDHIVGGAQCICVRVLFFFPLDDIFIEKRIQHENSVIHSSFSIWKLSIGIWCIWASLLRIDGVSLIIEMRNAFRC